MKEVTEEWIEEKAKELLYELAIYEGHFKFEERNKNAKDFIRSLVKEWFICELIYLGGG